MEGVREIYGTKNLCSSTSFHNTHYIVPYALANTSFRIIGAFLIPYWIMLFAEGLPMFLLEMAIGQRLRKGSLGAWDRVSPYWGGIGVASAIVSFNVALYYNTVIAWCLSYFVQVRVL